MKLGDLVKACWSDGYVCIGTYHERRQGYIILLDESNCRITCDPNCVTFEVIEGLPNG